jgi:hypothetical protein
LDRRWRAIDIETRNRAYDLSENAAIEVIGEDNRRAVWIVAPYPEALTYELIANLDEPFFLPLVVPDFNYKQN